MKCSNCGENDATMKFVQIINGIKNELFLCEECSQEMGLEDIDLNIPMDFSSFIDELFDNYNEDELLAALTDTPEEVCRNCGLTYEEFVKSGKLGCVNCYDVFKDRIDLITKNIQGTSNHVGRKLEGNSNNKFEIKNNEILSKLNDSEKINNKDEYNINILKDKLKKAVSEEKYEEAAKIRDEIKKLQE